MLLTDLSFAGHLLGVGFAPKSAAPSESFLKSFSGNYLPGLNAWHFNSNSPEYRRNA